MSLRRMQAGWIGVVGMVVAGCSGTSPTAPGTLDAMRTNAIVPGGAASRVPTTVSSIGDPVVEGRYLVCILSDDSRTQLSLAAWGMPGAAQYCRDSLNGRVHGIVTAPAPPAP